MKIKSEKKSKKMGKMESKGAMKGIKGGFSAMDKKMGGKK
jgi:hypothetical protein